MTENESATPLDATDLRVLHAVATAWIEVVEQAETCTHDCDLARRILALAELERRHSA